MAVSELIYESCCEIIKDNESKFYQYFKEINSENILREPGIIESVKIAAGFRLNELFETVLKRDDFNMVARFDKICQKKHTYACIILFMYDFIVNIYLILNRNKLCIESCEFYLRCIVIHLENEKDDICQYIDKVMDHQCQMIDMTKKIDL